MKEKSKQVMLFEEEGIMCGKGMMCQWEGVSERPSQEGLKLNDASRRGGRGGKHRWHKRGRKVGRAPWQQQSPYYKHGRPSLRPFGGATLRPVNAQGNRAPGMRAPRNTNQFLMHEKYQLLHMRSDSVGTDSGSDCEVDFTDMDSYLGVLENARGALLDCPGLSLPSSVKFCPRQRPKRQELNFFSFGDMIDQEESMQYFPSEDDVLQSEDFMQKDFIEFCNTIT